MIVHSWTILQTKQNKTKQKLSNKIKTFDLK